MDKQSFTFCVLAYNHSDFIIEHLESIKFQVLNYGENIACKLIVNDDASKDNTVRIIEEWLDSNSSIFTEVVVFFNSFNIGTSKSVSQVCEKIDTDYCKITAGDDVYTGYNIFSFIQDQSINALVSGVPIRLIDNEIKVSFFEVINYCASDIIYRNTKLHNRLCDISIINAPNLFYPVSVLKSSQVLDFIKNFDVVEDLPLQIAIAELEPDIELHSTSIPIVIYRRTSGSTYIVESERFINDQLKLFDYFIHYYIRKGSCLRPFLLKNRRFVFNLSWRLGKGVLNISRYIYALRFICLLPKIIQRYLQVKIHVASVKKHYVDIKLNSVK